MDTSDQSLVQASINTIRTLSIDAVQHANSGHPGLPLGAAPIAYVLWERHLRHNPRDPGWPDRDRFVLSAGHGSMLLYSLLHLTGYDVSIDDLKEFRRWESITPGHPEWRLTPGVEATTGPLGQGAANAVGMAIAERVLAHRFNRPDYPVVDHHTYALVSDGDLMEGVAAEAVSYAGHLGLGKLVFLYDSNDVTLDGPTSLTFSGEDVGRRFEGYRWQVLHVEDGDHNVEGIDAALEAAKAEHSRPSLIIVRTTLGYGSPNKSGKAEAHGSPLGEKEVALTKMALGCDAEGFFHIPEPVLGHFRAAVERGGKVQSQWQQMFGAYGERHPALAAEWHRTMRGELPEGWDREIPLWEAGDSVATRKAAGEALQAIARSVPWLIGGDADLSSSTQTRVKDGGSFDGQTGEGRNLRFGVREHAMGGICNGLAYHGGIRPYASTFLCFSDYMRPSVRLAAMNKLPVLYVWTHDSVELGEDGPTHQPVEHVMALRAIPNLTVIRPADANEAAEGWRWAMQHPEGPVAFILSRQKLPVVDRGRLGPARDLSRGAYILADAAAGEPQAVVIASGSEVAKALEAWEILAGDGIRCRVVSMPSWEIFEGQSDSYRDLVLPPHIKARVSIEAGVTQGWYRWIGEGGVAIGVDRFGASAPGEVIREKFGLTVGRVVESVRGLISGGG